ncbi:MAG: WhiB family transcriptional regulator [Actinobacteria bacterium ATB1]|nr:WhiB family transcriptional regulator [Actinobacteria bacterium ATB1]
MTARVIDINDIQDTNGFAAVGVEQVLDATPKEIASLAACNDGRGGLVELFYSDEIPEIRRAKEICAGCAVRVVCLEGALERREPCGVWGGQLFVSGKILPVKRPRGRPPKHKEQLTA